MKNILKLGIIISCLATTALAKQTEIEIMVLADSFGKLLAAEDYCELVYDQDAIDIYLEKNVDADNMEFSGYVDNEVWMANEIFKDHSKSQKRAFCSQMKRVAKHHKFIN